MSGEIISYGTNKVEPSLEARRPLTSSTSAGRLYRSDDLESRQSSCRAVSRTLPAGWRPIWAPL